MRHDPDARDTRDIAVAKAGATMSNTLVWIALIVAAVALFVVWILRDRLTDFRLKIGAKGAEASVKGASPKSAQNVQGADGAVLPLVDNPLQVSRGDAEIETKGAAVVRRSRQFSGGAAKLIIGGSPPPVAPPSAEAPRKPRNHP
jgi:hypothetical protein